jgi:hypothetical protein
MSATELNPQDELTKLIEKLIRTREQWDARRRRAHDVINATLNVGTQSKHRGMVKQLNICIADLDFIIARNRRNLCAWHRGKQADGTSDDPEPGCHNCGRLLATLDCGGCKKIFLDWECQTSDDVVAAPGVTTSGDVYCRECARRHDAEEERAEEDFDLHGP